MSYATTKGPTPPPPTLDSLPPSLAGHADYEIKRELGRGGMGVVYLAHNAMMGRDEVLKVIGRQIMDRPAVLERFLREIRAVARLRHPNIVAAYTAFRIEGGLVFAMEHVEGLDLSRLVKAKGPLPVAHAAYFAHQAALGLQHAYEKGMVHRDIKPHNLMLTHDGKARLVKILDFGLAKATREEKVDAGLTSHGQALGTPDYIAPEQILDAAAADIRADLYSLGATLFYLLTGRPPFQATSLYDLYQAHISRDADPLNLIRPEVPAELAALVAKLMAKDPARRFGEPAEVAEALKPFFKPRSAYPPTNFSQAGAAEPRSSAGAGEPATTEPASGAADRPIYPKATGAVSHWEGLIDLRESEPAQEKAVAVEPPRRPRRFWVTAPAVAACLLGVLVVAWLAGVFKVKTADGIIVLENVPKDAEVSVDSEKIDFTWPGSGSTIEIRVAPGRRKVEVKKDGFRTFGETVTIQGNGSDEVSVRLIPIEASIQRSSTTPSPSEPSVVGAESNPGNPQAGVTRPGRSADKTAVGSPGISPVVERPADRRVWLTDTGYRIEHTGHDQWQETGEDGTIFRWIEMSRNELFVLLYDGSRGGGGFLRLEEGQSQIRWTSRRENFRLFKRGNWVSTPEAARVAGRAGANPSVSTGSKALIVSGAWRVEGDELVQEGGAGTILLGEGPLANYDLRFRGRIDSGKEGFVAISHYTDAANFRFFHIGESGGSAAVSGSMHEGKEGGRSGPIRTTKGTWHDVLIKVRGAEHWYFLDGKQLYHDIDDRFAGGRVGLATWDANAHFRDIVVKSPDGRELWKGPPDLKTGAAPVESAIPKDRKAIVGSGSWRVEGRDLVQTHPKGGGLTFGDPSWSNYNLTLKALHLGGVMEMNLSFHGASDRDHCILSLGDTDDGPISSYFWYHHDGRTGRFPGGDRPIKFRPGQEFTVGLKIRGPEMTAYLDGLEWFHAVDPRFTKGNIGLATHAPARFWDIWITTPQGELLWEGPPELPK